MTCILHNHNFQNEVQVICQIFFPNQKFIFAEEIPITGYSIFSEINSLTSTAKIFSDGKELNQFTFKNTNFSLTPKRIVMLALYHALQSVFNVPAPWGSLTGIRPTKLVREWQSMGMKDEDIINTLTDPYMVSKNKALLATETANAENDLIKKIFIENKNAKGLYISIPFCPSKCLYCSFNTCQKPPDEVLPVKYVDKLIAEINSVDLTDVTGIYIGGGTPTVLNEDLLEKLFKAIPIKVDELTVEAGRPDTFTKEKLGILREYGTNRISVNPQTLNENTLKIIGRSHTVQDFYNGFELARSLGFESVNVDLIAGLPGENETDIQNTINKVVKLDPENITVHTLAIKRGTKLLENREGFILPQADTVWKMLKYCDDTIRENNLKPYYLYRQKNMTGLFENIGYSKIGFECLYNVGMMGDVQSVIGVGAGAVTKNVTGSLITRKFNAKGLDVYMKD